MTVTLVNKYCDSSRVPGVSRALLFMTPFNIISFVMAIINVYLFFCAHKTSIGILRIFL